MGKPAINHLERFIAQAPARGEPHGRDAQPVWTIALDP